MSLGGLSVLLLAWSLSAGSAVSKLIDNEARVYSDDRSAIQVSDSNYGGLVGVGLFWLAVAVAAAAVLRRPRGVRILTAFPILMLLAVGWWLVCSIVFHEPSSSSQPFFILGIAVVLAGVVRDPPTLSTLRSFNLLRDLTAALMLTTSIVDPGSSQLACRADKCGIFDSLFLGFFYTENAAAQFLLLLVPSAITIRSRAYLCFSLLLSATFLAAAGSRTSLLDFAIVTVFVLLYRRYVISDWGRPVSFPWRLVPITFLAVSAYVFLRYSSGELTGRGAIYEGIRDQLGASALVIGSGPDTMQNIFEAGLLGNFEALGEHGEVPHLLVQSGLPGVVLVAFALASLAFKRGHWTSSQIGGLTAVLAASLQFVTEPGWTLNPRSLNLAVMLLAIGLFIVRVDISRSEGEEADRT